MSAIQAAEKLRSLYGTVIMEAPEYVPSSEEGAEIIDRLAVQPAVKELHGALAAMLALAELDEVPATITQERHKALLSKYKGVE